VISTPGISLRAGTPGSGLAAPADDISYRPVLEVDDVPVYLNGLIVRGGFVGLHVHGWKGQLTLSGVDVFGQQDVGVYASDGSWAGVFDSTVRDGYTGVAAVNGATVNVQRSAVHDLYQGVVVFQRATAALSDCTIERNSSVGLLASIRSDVNVLGCALRENGESHVAATDFSTISLFNGVAVGAEGDATPWALGVARNATISSNGLPPIYGSASAIDNGSLRLGDTVLHGDLFVSLFSDVAVRDSQILGVVACRDGAQGICSQTATQGNHGCSPSCGSAPDPSVRIAFPDQERAPATKAPSLNWIRQRESRSGGAGQP
jgi:hypothetical protein